MSRHVHLDLVGGMAGDMFVAAMLDAFPESWQSCLNDLQASGVLEHVNVSLEPGKSHGLQVHRFVVNTSDNVPARTAHYRDLREFLHRSTLSDAVKHRSLALLALLAEAESVVHAVALGDVHFHEVADWDSVADVVAAGSMIEHNRIDSWSCSTVPLGSGQVQTEHGSLPVPAPAVLELLNGFAVFDDGEPGERITPTGAAILKYVMSDEQGALQLHTQKPKGTLAGTGTGAGFRELKFRPNILRCAVIERDAAGVFDGGSEDGMAMDEVNELSFAIDDMTPEELAVAIDHLRQVQGVLDVSSQAAMGKKGRAVFNVTVLCEPSAEVVVSRACFLQTSTLGIRIQHITRRILSRDERSIDNESGAVTVKLSNRVGRVSVKVASDDLQLLPTLEERRGKVQQIRNRLLPQKLDVDL